jgi:hypothetical protein
MSVYPNLYRIVRRKNLSVAQVLSTTPLNVSFRRALVGENWEDWLDLVGKVMTVTLTEHKVEGVYKVLLLRSAGNSPTPLFRLSYG